MKKFSMVLFLSFIASFAQENLSSWSHFKMISLNTTATGAAITSSQTKFPIIIKLTAADSDVFNGSQMNGQDIRFCKASNGLRLNHEIETWDKANKSAAIWVLVDSIKGSDSSAYLKMLWGNGTAKDSSRASAVFDTANGFQGVWHFSEAQGDLAKDATINNYSGTPYGTQPPADTVGVCGRAKKYDGATTYFAMLGSGRGKVSFPTNSNFTLSGWAFLNRIVPGDQIIVTKSELQYRLKAITGWRGFNFNAGYDGIESSPAAINVWKHVAFVKGDATKHLYVDGLPDEANPYFLVNAGKRLDTVDVLVGRGVEGNKGYLLGKLDEIRLESKDRSQDWLKLCFANQKIIGQSFVTLGATKLNSSTKIMDSRGSLIGKSKKEKAGHKLVDIKGRRIKTLIKVDGVFKDLSEKNR